MAQVSIYDILCSSKNDAKRTEIVVSSSRFLTMRGWPLKGLEIENTAGLSTIGKPRNGDSKTPCLTMLADKQQQNKTKLRIICACVFAHFQWLPTPNDAVKRGKIAKVFTSAHGQRPTLEHRRFQRGAAV